MTAAQTELMNTIINSRSGDLIVHPVKRTTHRVAQSLVDLGVLTYTFDGYGNTVYSQK